MGLLLVALYLNVFGDTETANVSETMMEQLMTRSMKETRPARRQRAANVSTPCVLPMMLLL
jgi:hypothetical protein